MRRKTTWSATAKAALSHRWRQWIRQPYGQAWPRSMPVRLMLTGLQKTAAKMASSLNGYNDMESSTRKSTIPKSTLPLPVWMIGSVDNNANALAYWKAADHITDSDKAADGNITKYTRSAGWTQTRMRTRSTEIPQRTASGRARALRKTRRARSGMTSCSAYAAGWQTRAVTCALPRTRSQTFI